MNKELKGREYNLPPDIIKHLNSQLQISSTDTVGTNRAKELIQSGKVNYGQLKRILHDLKNVDKLSEPQKMGGISGERKNSFLKKHSKKPDFLPNLNFVKNNSFKSPITSLGLFEEIERIKNLM